MTVHGLTDGLTDGGGGGWNPVGTMMGSNSKCVWGMSFEAETFARLHTNA